MAFVTPTDSPPSQTRCGETTSSQQITRFHAPSLSPSSFHLQQAGRIFHRAQQLRDPRPLVSRCLLLPFTLEVNSSSWQATFIALLVLRGDNHHVRSRALGQKWGSGGREAKRGWGSGRTTGPSSHNAEESSPDRASHQPSRGARRARGDGTPTSPRGGVRAFQ